MSTSLDTHTTKSPSLPTNSTRNATTSPPPRQHQHKQTFLNRLEHFTWAWFCLPMSTGGIALLLSPAIQPHTFPGLNTIGKATYILDLAIFLLVTAAITYRFLRYRGTFTASLTHPTESLFAATALLSLASIIACTSRYGISTLNAPWLITTYRILFWTYFTTTFLFAILAYTLLFTSPRLKISDMTPAWDLPIFPFMLSGTLASSGALYQAPSSAVPMIIAGVTAQGLGFTMSILMYASYIRRMIQFGFPKAPSAPAMFIAVGPPAFTSLALIGMANDWPQTYVNYFGATIPYTHANGVDAVLDSQQQQLITIHVLRVMALVASIFVYALSAWFFAIALIANLRCAFASSAVSRDRDKDIDPADEFRFRLNWWAFVFPNTGFTIATISIGKTLMSPAVEWVGSVMSVLMVCMWLFVAVSHVLAVWRGGILMAGRDEDVYWVVGKGKVDNAERVEGAGGKGGDVEKLD